MSDQLCLWVNKSRLSLVYAPTRYAFDGGVFYSSDDSEFRFATNKIHGELMTKLVRADQMFARGLAPTLTLAILERAVENLSEMREWIDSNPKLVALLEDIKPDPQATQRVWLDHLACSRVVFPCEREGIKDLRFVFLTSPRTPPVDTGHKVASGGGDGQELRVEMTASSSGHAAAGWAASRGVGPAVGTMVVGMGMGMGKKSPKKKTPSPTPSMFD